MATGVAVSGLSAGGLRRSALAVAVVARASIASAQTPEPIRALAGEVPRTLAQMLER